MVRDFYNPNVPAMHKRELGQAIYLGWAAAVILVISGAVLCSTCPLMERGGRYRRGYIGRSFANSPAAFAPPPDPPKPISSSNVPMKEYV